MNKKETGREELEKWIKGIKEMTGKRKNGITNKELLQVRQRFIAKSFILIDRCQKGKEKKRLVHLWDENEWQNMVDFIDTSFKDTKDENIKELREIAVEFVKIDKWFAWVERKFLENEMAQVIKEWEKKQLEKKHERL